MAITISPATTDQIPAIVSFVMAGRTKMFPMLDPRIPLPDLVNFQQTYLDHPDGFFLTAHADGQLVATIAYLPYNHRFAHLNLGQERIVEVVRLYVSPFWRRGGLASMLFSQLAHQARKAGIERFYLHTHPFLAGAVQFWERQGFTLLDVENDPVWRTTHMTRLCKGLSTREENRIDSSIPGQPWDKIKNGWSSRGFRDVDDTNGRACLNGNRGNQIL
ncbi:unnamed protein product [Clonostachys byssicola]|uniref:N-acetyltransferase domain-containing protein n=1 Tax=Clonostachys byssicola TaxID=160290 RepID=A0A9N9UVT7_9HYPO|nr:unnamed protein product [Clonostachys byssicola]